MSWSAECSEEVYSIRHIMVHGDMEMCGSCSKNSRESLEHTITEGLLEQNRFWKGFCEVELTPLSPRAHHCCCGKRVNDFLFTLAERAVEIPNIKDLVILDEAEFTSFPVFPNCTS